MNPRAAAAERHAIEWALAHGLVRHKDASAERLARIGIGALVGRAYPYAGHEALLICAEWLTWLFVYDDLCDESARPGQLDALSARLLGVLDGLAPAPGDPPLVAALAAVYHRVQAAASPECAFRIAKLMAPHFMAARWQVENRARGHVPDLETYRLLRRHSGAVYTCFELIDLAAGIDLPVEVRDDDAVLRLGDLANDAIGWCNDLVSLPKEDEDGDVHNLVVVLERHHGLTREAAQRKALSMHDEAIAAFVALAARLPSFGPEPDPNRDAQLQRYVDGLRACVRANLDFCLLSPRYQAPTAVPLAA